MTTIVGKRRQPKIGSEYWHSNGTLKVYDGLRLIRKEFFNSKKKLKNIMHEYEGTGFVISVVFN